MLLKSSKNCSLDDWSCDIDYSNWLYYLLGQAVFSFGVFFVTVIGEWIRVVYASDCVK